MSERYKFHDPDALYFVTMTIVKWLPVLADKEFCRLILESLKFCQKEKGLIIHCWCIMPNHIHLIISRSKPEFTLGNIIRDFKKFTAKDIIRQLDDSNLAHKYYVNIFRRKASQIKRNKNFKVWKDGSHPILLDTNFLIDQKLEYIHYNPVKANLCEAPEDYVWSSARDYMMKYKGELAVEFIT